MTKSLRGEKTCIDGVQKKIWSNITSSTSPCLLEAKNPSQDVAIGSDSCASLDCKDEHG